MKSLNKKNLRRFIVSLFVLVVAAIPVKVFAFSYADLGTAYADAKALCGARGSSSEYCTRANTYKLYLMAASKEKTDSAKQKYIDTIPVEWRGAIYTKTVNAYDADVKAGKIGSGSTDSSRIDSSGSCPDGQVEVAISPTSNGDNCVGGKNPIYTYLKDIIVFIGGAIGLAVVITIIVAGIQYSSSAGNPANITKAKERLTNAVIGLVLYLFLAAILRYLVPQIFS